MKLFIYFDGKGNILSAVKVLQASQGYHPFAHVHEDHRVMEAPLTADLRDLQAHEISEQYHIDIKGQQLKKKVAKAVAKKGRKN